ncbi:MAG: hypothetical protein KatS3mg022_3587 [Armatimonadota bacterium]|nr:MAG: hypothetical protein KatS3mg022_3587 [Armatimonadota bacterium]GIV20495.1 MAG: hypothetical protein KatS3mg023_2246 [Armatimonadota bacterium]GIV22103.1 MAG: hypothetical protein KatS3mg023_3854 [Armatimonadota bacterium]
MEDYDFIPTFNNASLNIEGVQLDVDGNKFTLRIEKFSISSSIDSDTIKRTQENLMQLIREMEEKIQS